jgi:hypothetical protein
MLPLQIETKTIITRMLALLVFVCATVIAENPVLPGDHPDPSIVRVGNVYWAASTSAEWAPAWAISNSWAPELTNDRGQIRVYYAARKRSARVTLKTTGLRPDELAGIAMIGDRQSAAGLGIRNGRLYEWRRDEGKFQTLATAPLAGAGRIDLRVQSTETMSIRLGYSTGIADCVSVLPAAVQPTHVPSFKTLR